MISPRTSRGKLDKWMSTAPLINHLDSHVLLLQLINTLVNLPIEPLPQLHGQVYQIARDALVPHLHIGNAPISHIKVKKV